jgi:hypothetical protein
MPFFYATQFFCGMQAECKLNASGMQAAWNKVASKNFSKRSGD